MIPKNPGIFQKGTPKSENSPERYSKILREHPKKVPKIMAHPRVVTLQVTPPPHPEVKSRQIKKKKH